MLNYVPQPGDRYRHFKGTEYKILGVTRATITDSEWNATVFHATHTETEKVLAIASNDETPDQYWAYDEGQLISEPLVLYYADFNKVWARPLNNFCQILCNGKPVEGGASGSDRTQYYRFQRINP